VKYDERTKTSSYKASHYTLMILLAILAIIVIYSSFNDIKHIDIGLLSLIILPVTVLWLIIFEVIKRK